MQNLFTTGAVPVSSINQQGVSSASYQTGTATGTADYNTMQNLFATGNQSSAVNQGGFTMAQLQANPSALNVNLSTSPATGTADYNTMQNLLATGAQTGSAQQQPTQQQQQPNLQNINIQDFNTMQNLFKTGNVQLTPPSASTTITNT